VEPVALIVQKYGGTSVADPDRMRAVAENVAFTRRHGNDVVVVPSAMGKTTDNLIKLANDVSKTQPGREMDMLITTGERIKVDLKEGDRVLFQKYSGTEFKLDDEEYIVLSEKDILALIES